MRNTHRPNMTCTRLIAVAMALLVPALPTVGDESSTGHGAHTDRARVLERALAVSPEYTVPVTDKGEPLALFADLNGDARLDVSLLTIVSDPRIVPTVTRLSDSARLYTRDPVEPVFIVESYFQGQGAIVTVELGRRLVFAGMTLRPLSGTDFAERPGGDPGAQETETAESGATGTGPPLAIVVEFSSRDGADSEVIVFQPGGVVSRVSLATTRNRWGDLVDMDRDGDLEIVTSQRVPEAGVGFETFLELRELGPDGYRRTDSVAVVRELNEFLREAAAAIEAERWETVWSLVGWERSEAAKPPEPDVGLEEIFRGIAADEELEESAFDYPETGRNVDRVMTPRISDNPFARPYFGRAFTVVLRVECCDELPRLFEAVVGMARNPFSERTFAFLPLAFLTDQEPGQ